MTPVRTIEEIRLSRLLQLLERPEFPTIQAFADRIERAHAQVSQWKTRAARKKNGVVVGYSHIDSASARHIEERLGLPRGWMDNDPATGSFDEPANKSDIRALSSEQMRSFYDNLKQPERHRLTLLLVAGGFEVPGPVVEVDPWNKNDVNAAPPRVYPTTSEAMPAAPRRRKL